MHALQVQAREVRRRLWQQPNGRQSSEMEIVTEPELRKRRIAVAQAESDRRYLERHAAELLQAKRRAELFQDFIEAHKRTGFSYRKDQDGTPIVGFEQIARATCRHFDLKRVHVFSPRRDTHLARARQIIMYLAKELTGMSLPQIGAKLGGRDHTTVIHGHRKVAQLLSAGDPTWIRDVSEIRQSIESPVPACVPSKDDAEG